MRLKLFSLFFFLLNDKSNKYMFVIWPLKTYLMTNGEPGGTEGLKYEGMGIKIWGIGLETEGWLSERRGWGFKLRGKGLKNRR